MLICFCLNAKASTFGLPLPSFMEQLGSHPCTPSSWRNRKKIKFKIKIKKTGNKARRKRSNLKGTEELMKRKDRSWGDKILEKQDNTQEVSQQFLFPSGIFRLFTHCKKLSIHARHLVSQNCSEKRETMNVVPHILLSIALKCVQISKVREMEGKQQKNSEMQRPLDSRIAGEKSMGILLKFILLWAVIYPTNML